MIKRNKLGQFTKGSSNPWNRGKTGVYSEGTLKRMSKIHKRIGSCPPSAKGRKHTKGAKEKMSQVRKGKKTGRVPKTAFKRGHTTWNKGLTKEIDERVKKKAQALKERWQNPEYAQKMIRAFMVKPNKPEILLNELLNKILPNEYKYVGDGQFILGGKCPDFLNINGKKKLIELFGDYWHRNDDPQERIDYFKKYGFDTLVIWESELDKKRLKSRILEFSKIN